MCAILQIQQRIGKQITQSTVNSLLADTHHFLLHIYDNRSGKYFLVDTGSALSIIPPNKSDLKRTYNRHLIAANGTPIKTFGIA